MKILSVVGARPQFIKAAAVSRALRQHRRVREVLLHTGQHYDANMSAVFFQELDIPAPDYHLGIGGGTHAQNTGRMMEAIEAVLLEEQPDWVIVYGDTDSTLAGALAAVKIHIPVAHVEAGLRSFNRQMPEEINRILTDHIADLLFAPTQTAVHHLQNEGVPQERIHLVGDVMCDAARYYAHKAQRHSRILSTLSLEPHTYLLATVHRAENTDHPARLLAIMEALNTVGAQRPVVLPLHPRTQRALHQIGHPPERFPHIRFTQPVGYLDMIQLEQHAWRIATDSGGVQKEAYFFRVPCITLREETEWVELVQTGWNRLVPPLDAQPIIQALTAPFPPGQEIALYGGGTASQRIAEILQKA